MQMRENLFGAWFFVLPVVYSAPPVRRGKKMQKRRRKKEFVKAAETALVLSLAVRTSRNK
jgi:hypothetical protein